MTHPNQSRQYYLWQRCPEQGWSAAAAEAALGPPDRRSGGDPALWQYFLDSQGAIIELQLKDSLVTGWTVDFRTSKWKPSPGLSASRTDIDRVQAYLARSPGVADKEAYLLYHRCPIVGMTREMILASLGLPSRQVESGSTTHWMYLLGFEGQSLELTLEADSIRSLEVP